MKKTTSEIENLIEKEIARLSKDYELDLYDINEIRTDFYKANGWAYDPNPEENEDKNEESETIYLGMYERLTDLGMSERDFL